MSFDDFRRADALFERALELPRSERSDFVRQASHGDVALQHAVMVLLEDASSDDLPTAGALAGETWQQLAQRVARVEIGDQVGRFVVVEELGRGGMAIVYRAKRIDDVFDQEVALKVMRPSPLSDAYEERFAQERQILASLRHPNIAQIYDGGGTSTGHPYFAMELVEGKPIDEHCEENSLAINERLDLILQVIDALAAAHRLLIVHRDLKPSNVLVTDEGHVKLLDFGIAKIIESAEIEAGITGDARVLTPQFASPEQLRGEPVSTAADIYQLGALMYLLLAGTEHHDVTGKSLLEVQRVVSEEDPAPPSERLERLAASKRLRARDLRGDLDAIILKALRRDPAHRYRTLDEVRDDIHRHLEGAPVSARGDAWLYRLSSFVKRHRLLALGAAGVVIYAVSVSILGVRLASREAEARESARRAVAVTDFLETLLGETDPGQAGVGGLSARDLLLRAPERMDRGLREDPELEARILLLTAEVLYRLGDRAEAIRRIAPLLRDQSSGQGDTAHLDYLRMRARLLEVWWLGLQDQQEQALEDLDVLEAEIGRMPRASSVEAEELRGRLELVRARALLTSGRRSEAAEAAERAETSFSKLPSGAERLLLRAADEYAFIFESTHQDPDLALRLVETSLERHEEFYGPQHPLLIGPIRSLARALGSRGFRIRAQDREQSDAYLNRVDELVERALALSIRHYGGRSLDVVAFHELRAALAYTREEWDDCYDAYAAAREVLEELADVGVRSAQNVAGMARCEMSAGNIDAAVALLAQAREETARQVGETHVAQAILAYDLADLHHREERWSLAAEHAERGLEIYRRLGTQTAARFVETRLLLAEVLIERGADAARHSPQRAANDFERAEELLEQIEATDADAARVLVRRLGQVRAQLP